MERLNKFEIVFLHHLAKLCIRFEFPAQVINLLKGVINRYPSEIDLYFFPGDGQFEIEKME